MNYNANIYIIIAAVVSYLIRVIPLTIFRKPINNRFIKSFLYYVPYVTLAVMTFPAIIQTTESPIPGILALVAGIIASFFGAGLLPVAGICCIIVYISQMFI